MPRLLFHKMGNAIWMSHLDLMRLFQRAFKRAGFSLTHTQGFNPRPSVSIALPLSVGIESRCELLDFDLEGENVPCSEIKTRLNAAIVEGVKVLDVYENGAKIKNLALLDCTVILEYDKGIPEGGEKAIASLFSRECLMVEKKGKNGVTDQDIIPMIRRTAVRRLDGHTVSIDARICCQNPTLNPTQIISAVSRYLPELQPDFAKCCRNEIYDKEENIFR